MRYLLRILLTALIIVVVTEVSKKNPRLGAIVGSLPLVSILALTWLYRDEVETSVLVEHATSTLWFVLPSLVFFVVFPLLVKRGTTVPLSMLAGAGLTALAYVAMERALRLFGVGG